MSAVYSPHVKFLRKWGDPEIYVMDANGGNVTQLTDNFQPD